MADPSIDPSLWEKIAGWLWLAVAALVTVLHRGNTKRMDTMETGIKALELRMPSDFEREELTRQRIQMRDNIIKIFDQLKDDAARATTRHLELLAEINKKADR